MAETFANIKGFDALSKTLEQIPVKLEANILRGAVRAAAKVVEAEAEKRVPHGKTGNLAASLRISTGLRNGVVTAAVKAGGKSAFYANMVEGGTRPHLISASKSKRLRIGATVIYPTTVQHPGAKAEPFMGPALASSFDAAIEATRAYIEKRLDKIL